jgi:hypothetical protein
MNAWVLSFAAAWTIGAAAVCVLLAAGRRHRDRQAAHRARALQARRHAPAWTRTNQHRRTR